MVLFWGNHYSLYKFLQYKKKLSIFANEIKNAAAQPIINGGRVTINLMLT